jgi:hypothetical protein
MYVCLKLPLKKAAITNTLIILPKKKKIILGAFSCPSLYRKQQEEAQRALVFQRAVTR